MKSIRRPLCALSLFAMTSVLAPACADNNATLFIQQVIAPTPPECTYKPDPGGLAFGSGSMDVGLRSSYTAGLLVGNQYTPRGDKENLRAETTRVRLQGAEVRLSDTDGKDLMDAFSIFGSGTVNAASGEIPGYGVFVGEIIPESLGTQLRAELEGTTNTRTVIVNIRVFGETTGGQEIESAEFTFPISVCYGCLVAYPLEARGTDGALNAVCNQNADRAADPPCLMGQDAVTDCRLCSDLNLCFLLPAPR